MEAATNGDNGRRRVVVVKESDAEKDREDDHHDDDEANIKKMIASHPLYGLLIESHFNCLKVILSSFLIYTFFLLHWLLVSSFYYYTLEFRQMDKCYYIVHTYTHTYIYPHDLIKSQVEINVETRNHTRKTLIYLI